MSKKERGNLLDVYMDQIRRHPPLSSKEEHDLAVEYFASHNPKIAICLATNNLRLVVKIAYEYSQNPDQLLDLIQEGNLGLLRAIDRFDPHREIKLASFASWWIRAYMLRYLIKNARLVRMGTTDIQRRLFWLLNKEISIAEAQGVDMAKLDIILADRLGQSVHIITDMRVRMEAKEFSISDLGSELLDHSPRPDVAVESKQFGRALIAAIHKFAESLRERERDIFFLRLNQSESLQSMGERYGISSERVRQIESQNIQELRIYLVEILGEAVVPAASGRRKRRRAATEAA